MEPKEQKSMTDFVTMVENVDTSMLLSSTSNVDWEKVFDTSDKPELSEQ